ncbi:unnamed protein product [Ectocarpus sp. CCAP 1310/34]|nr:unnamed protein product [Ectocarpus sp. CCAP 1310/34]
MLSNYWDFPILCLQHGLIAWSQVQHP